MAILDLHRDLPIRIRLALKAGVDPEHLARATRGLLPGEAVKVIDRIRSGVAVSYYALTCVEAALLELQINGQQARRDQAVSQSA